MSKYDLLWRYVSEQNQDSLTLSFSDVEKAAGLPVDHSLLNCKKELLAYGFEVKKISLKGQTIQFVRLGNQ